MDADDLLVPYEGLITDNRNATPLSRLCESIIATFLSNNAISASVRYELTEYDLETLWMGLRRVSLKSSYRELVRVQKREETILLHRKNH